MLQALSVFVFTIISVREGGALKHLSLIPSSYCTDKPNKTNVIFYYQSKQIINSVQHMDALLYIWNL